MEFFAAGLFKANTTIPAKFVELLVDDTPYKYFT